MLGAHIAIATAILLLTPPLTGVAIILLVRCPPRLRSTLAFGTSFLLMAFALGMLGVAGALLEGRQPFFPYLLVSGLPAITVARMMHLELNPRPFPLPRIISAADD